MKPNLRETQKTIYIIIVGLFIRLIINYDERFYIAINIIRNFNLYKIIWNLY